MLTAEWTHKLPFIQSTSPAKRAAALIIRTLDRMPEVEKGKFSIVDFCSGGGGACPLPPLTINIALKGNLPPAGYDTANLDPQAPFP